MSAASPDEPAVAVDFETEYSASYTVRKLGHYAYCADPRFNAYLVAVCDGSTSSACHPRDFDWRSISGKLWISHNAGFDRVVFRRLQEQRIIPADVAPSRWLCTASLASYLQAPRDLTGAARTLVGLNLDKNPRRRAKGQDSRQLTLTAEMSDYARADAGACHAIWRNHAHRWPEAERRLAELTMDMGDYGLAINRPALDEAIVTLDGLLVETLKEIPWSKTHAPTSPIALAEACTAAGIPAPPSTARTSAEFDSWAAEYGERFPLVRTMQHYRRLNRTKAVLEAMRTRIKPDGRLAYELLYFGATQTGRWSGSNGWNAQNLNRADCEGVDIRRLIVPAPGHNFIIADYAQIEARVTLFLAGDTEALEAIRAGQSVYQVHAVKTMAWGGQDLKKENPKLYALAKARVLGLGFGCGAARFVHVAKVLGGITLNFSESERVVREYRRSNSLIVQTWRELEAEFRARDGKTYFMYLPSGRYLRYFDVDAKSMTCSTVRGGHREKIFGGRLLENKVQATARDIMAAAGLRLHDAGYRVVLSVHDELVVEAPANCPLADPRVIAWIMCQPPPWAEVLPLSVETTEAQEYCK
ncbi:MAG TPA: DNA polymerase [Kiritimatiellia bacterium]|nr:DNA polymerase [Kiritimatiellia bacterium]HSA17489.1 DNA polymerase [Kiritimatiellia bacterium]